MITSDSNIREQAKDIIRHTAITEGVMEYGEKLAKNIEEAHKFAREALKMSSMRMKRHYDIHAKTTRFEVGNSVWLFSSYKKKGLAKKLMRPWTGPYLVIKRLNDLVYKIRLTPQSKPKIVHRNRLWKYSGRVREAEDIALRRSQRVRRQPDRF